MNGIFGFQREVNPTIYYNLYGPCERYSKWNESLIEDMWSYLSKSLSVEKVIQTLNTMMAAGDEGERGLLFNGCWTCILWDEKTYEDGW